MKSRRASTWIFTALALSAIVLFAPYVVKPVVCLLFGIMLGLLTKRDPSMLWTWPLSAALGFASADLDGIDLGGSWHGLFMLAFICTGSIALSILGYILGKWLPKKWNSYVAKTRMEKELDDYQARLLNIPSDSTSLVEK